MWFDWKADKTILFPKKYCSFQDQITSWRKKHTPKHFSTFPSRFVMAEQHIKIHTQKTKTETMSNDAPEARLKVRKAGVVLWWCALFSAVWYQSLHWWTTTTDRRLGVKSCTNVHLIKRSFGHDWFCDCLYVAKRILVRFSYFFDWDFLPPTLIINFIF